MDPAYLKNHVSRKSALCRQTPARSRRYSHGKNHDPRDGICANDKKSFVGDNTQLWNTEFSPGGSSGGSAAAVSAGMTTLADGTDGGGSIRIPSFVYWYFGYKPPFGRNPIDGGAPRESLIHFGLYDQKCR